MLTTTTTPNLLLGYAIIAIKPILRKHYRTQEDCWAALFQSCKLVLDIDITLVSHYLHGRRRIHRGYALHYADRQAPLCPRQLLDDISDAIACCNLTECDMIITNIVKYCTTYVDVLDRPMLLCDAPSCHANKASTANTLAKVIWHAICHDLAGI